MPKKRVSQFLHDLAKIFEERNRLYGDSYKQLGMALYAVLGPVELRTPNDIDRFLIFANVYGKMERYAANFRKGGHDDSLDDAAVYAMMLKELDEIARPIGDRRHVRLP